MPINKTGSFSGESIQKAHSGSGQAQDGVSGNRAHQGQGTQTFTKPPQTTGSAPGFQNNGNNSGGTKPK